jgi:hypothetical protein
MFENCVYDANGGVLCEYQGYPFHCTAADTPNEWAQLQALIADGGVAVAPYAAPPAPSAAQVAAFQAENARASRDALMLESDWVVNRHRDQTDAGGGTTLTSSQYTAWLTYRQALRDISKQSGWPASVTWPTSPPPASNDPT